MNEPESVPFIPPETERHFETLAWSDILNRRAITPAGKAWLRSDAAIERFHALLTSTAANLQSQITAWNEGTGFQDRGEEWRGRTGALLGRVQTRLAEINPIVRAYRRRTYSVSHREEVDELVEAIREHRESVLEVRPPTEEDQDLWSILDELEEEE